MCIAFDDKTKACAGGSDKGKPTERWGAIDLARFTGDSESGATETIVDALGFPGEKPSVKVPTVGQTVESSVEYADLKVKSGQVIRLLAKQTGGQPKNGDGSFPIVLLTLK
jgi:hypothetical protein